MMKALVTGATGFIGHRLLGKLERPVVLSRDAVRAEKQLQGFGVRAAQWEPQRGPPPVEAFDGVDVVFHLAGDPVAEGRWTAAKKASIRNSRVIGTRNLVAGFRGLVSKPRVLISGSAVGYYGDRADEELDERSPSGNDFLAQVCIEWEREALAAQQLDMRVVCLRSGIVLGPGGGALAKMLTPFKMGMGGPLGSGNQYMPWVHIDDLVELMLFAAQHESINGPLNGVAPNPVTNREFTKTLGRALGRPTVMPAVPAFVLRTMVGDMAEMLLASQRVLPRAAIAAGCTFRFPDLESALRNVLKA
jgi:uncharacterized protein (TIGR01777 family)